jgi:hypothetical protein
LFIPYHPDFNEEQFAKIIIDLAEKYNQESILIYSVSNGAVLHYPNSDRVDIIGNKIAYNKIAEIYTKLRSTSAKTFTFEGYRIPQNHIDAYSFRANCILFNQKSS